MGDRYVKSDENKKIVYIDANNLYRHSMSQRLPYNEIKVEKDICLKEILNTLDISDFALFLEVDLGYPYKKDKKLSISYFVLKINPNLKTYLRIM